MWRFFCLVVLGVAFNTSWSLAASLGQPRVTSYAGYTRLVFDVPFDSPYQIQALGAALKVSFSGQAVTPASVRLGKPEVSGYTLENGGGNAIATIATPQGVSSRHGFRAQRLEPSAGQSGFRLVLDFSGAYGDISEMPAVAALELQKAKGQQFTVVLDPGHGGNDQGALGNGLIEASLNLSLAFRVKKWLEGSGIHIEMTRTDARVFSNDKRTDLNARAVASRGKTAFVSIHANAITRNLWNSTYGMEVYYYDSQRHKPWFVTPAPAPRAASPESPLASPDAPTSPSDSSVGAADNQPAPANVAVAPSTPDTPITPNSNGFGTWEPLEPNSPSTVTSPEAPLTALVAQPERVAASKDLAAGVLSHMLGATAAASRGVQVADFYVIKYSECPAILIEMGFVTHPIEALQLKNSSYLDRAAYGIALGILEYVEGLVISP